MRSRLTTAIRSAATANRFNPRIANGPKIGQRQTAIRHGICRERNAAVLNNTNREKHPGKRAAVPMPIAPPQSWASNVI